MLWSSRLLVILAVLHTPEVALTASTSSDATSDCIAAVRAAKLADHDSTAPPKSKRLGPYKAGTDVQVELRIFKILNVDMSAAPWSSPCGCGFDGPTRALLGIRGPFQVTARR